MKNFYLVPLLIGRMRIITQDNISEVHLYIALRQLIIKNMITTYDNVVAHEI